MRHRMLLLAPMLLAGCPDPEPKRNPPQLWLALVNNNERMVQLIPEEPEPF